MNDDTFVYTHRSTRIGLVVIKMPSIICLHIKNVLLLTVLDFS